MAAFPELPVRIELAATGGVRNALESGEMQADSWTLFGLELQKCVQVQEYKAGCPPPQSPPYSPPILAHPSPHPNQTAIFSVEEWLLIC